MSVLIVGGGAAGLMAAITAAQSGNAVTVLERNERPARKILVTGKGRCNVTNACADLRELIAQIPGNGSFLYSALSRWMPADTMDFFETHGVPLKVERGRRVFPASDRAMDIADALVKTCRLLGVTFVHGRAMELLLENGTCLGVRCADGTELRADTTIVATGGLSYPQTGSTGDGYALAQQAGHSIVPTRPSLVGLECHEGFVSRLAGLALRNVTLRACADGQVVFDELGELLFTHTGVSGPLVLSASAHLRGGAPYTLEIDLKPGRTAAQLEERLLREISNHSGRNFINCLNYLLPKSLVPVVMALAQLPLDLQGAQMTREQRRRLAELLKALPLTVTGFRPIEEAVITAGGVDVREIDPKNMASRRVRGLHFAGEVLDVDAYTGGYNLQIAFATGRAAVPIEA
ncbi:MAG: NAD(P)/FAD-dependent oxidoreductase [Oscillospiraceae bacterium]|jgi:predicted Rossmann fold flavoprotein|nr:NAD(P)/FAD-dependent oxidoreductase [Oscillospiraceae bacterium]